VTDFLWRIIVVQAVTKSGQVKSLGFTAQQFKSVISGDEKSRVEALKELLDYPILQKDPQGSRFWYLRPGIDKEKAQETCPIAVGFYSELNSSSNNEISNFLTTKEPQPEIYRHYIRSAGNVENQPVMYLLLPEAIEQGKVVLVLPTEGRIRQRQIQIFDWSDREFLGRLERLKQENLKIVSRGIAEIPLVDWVFYPGVKTAQKLAQLMAEIARQIEQAIPGVMAAPGKNEYLHELFESFRKELLPTLEPTADNDKDYSFADIYAQTIAYGLFTARVFSYIKFKQYQAKHPGYDIEPDFYRDNAWESLPETNPFLRKLFKDISNQKIEALGEELVGSVSELLSVLRAAEMEAVLLDFQQKIGQEDIVIRFYEDFLAAYKPKMREKRGVYYTPEPVVSYMVRSVDELLKDKFNKPLGIADPEVMILDPACGTGTFLLWIFQLIHKRFQESPEALTEGLEDKSWSGYVKERLLPRVFGFELLMASYAIAHLKLGLFLEETGYQFDSGKRLGVYLTNSLENEHSATETLFEEFITEEANQATDIKKNKQIMVVLGNPPYSYESNNKGKWIGELVRDYYQVDGQPLGEKNPKGLQDDYVKFIRFGQWRIDSSSKGIFAYITNHGFLDNPTFRGMRQQLMNSFDALYFYDLHGNTKKKEKSPDGSPDVNVFDIQQGVSITLGIKGVKKSVYHCNLHGERELKYQELTEKNINSTQWKQLNPQTPFHLFVPQNTALLSEYQVGWSVKDIFPVNSAGIITARDALTIHYSQEEVWNTVVDFAKLSPEEAREKYRLGDDTRDWKIQLAQKDLKASGINKANIKPLLYRLFDVRHTYYTSKSRGFLSMPRGQVMGHMVSGKNIGLITVRQVAEGIFNHSFVTDSLVECRITLSNKGYGLLFPLYLYPDSNNSQQSFIEEKRHLNLSQDFLNSIKLKLGYTPNPESIFYYIYAILHSPTYRTRYAEFLKIDFPRIPLTSNDELFCQLADYGEQLVQLHLMTSPKLDNLITEFVEGTGERTVASGHPKYQNGAVQINKNGDKFTGVPESVWKFYVGGYQPCQKWLKDRKERTLSDEDILHYQKIVVSLKETIEIMKKIDEGIPSFPIE
jgi:type I restriction-modification system DNA methylase subunit